MNSSRFSHINALRIKFDLAIKYVQAGVIICANLVETTFPLLHTKFQGHWPFVPENKIFKGFLSYMGVVALTFETYL